MRVYRKPEAFSRQPEHQFFSACSSASIVGKMLSSCKASLPNRRTACCNRGVGVALELVNDRKSLLDLVGGQFHALGYL